MTARKKITLIDGTGNVRAAIVNRYDYTPNVGDYHSICGNMESFSGTIIKIELVLDVPNEEATGLTKVPGVPT